MKGILAKIIVFYSRRSVIDYFVVGAAALGVIFPLLGSQGLWDPYESHAAEVARGAAEEGRWFPLHYDGKVLPYLPPLFFWLEGVWMKLAGSSELSVRLPAAVISIACLLLALAAARRLVGRWVAFLASVAILTSPFFYGNARHTSPHLIATMLSFCSVLWAVVLLREDGASRVGGRLRSSLPWVLAASAFLTGGFLFILFILFSALGVLLAGLLGVFPPPDIRRLRSLPGAVVLFFAAAAWLVSAWLVSGDPLPWGIANLQVLSFGAMREFCQKEVFTLHLAHTGHMLFPWFALLPAGVIWLGALAPEEDQNEAMSRRLLLSALVGGPFLLLCTASLLLCYLPLDMIAVCPSLALVGVWGLLHAGKYERTPRGALLLSFGALLIVLGCTSLGVDFFWALKKPIEVLGYTFDRPYPELGSTSKFVYNSITILAGASVAPLLLVRRHAWVAAVTFPVVSLFGALFVIHQVYRTSGEYFTAKELADAYRDKRRTGDLLVTYAMEPQSRGGEVFYFKGKVKHLRGYREMLKVMEAQAGKGRVIFITSHVRKLYNDVFRASCGVRVKPLNDKRRWYAISSYEGPPPTDPGAVSFARIEDVSIQQPMNTKFSEKGKVYFSFLGFGMGNLDADGRSVRRGSWIDLELFWRCEEKTTDNWKIYLDATSTAREGKGTTNVSQHHEPACGWHPTIDWTPGEIVRDFLRFYFPSDLEPGPYILRTGIFLPKGRRMRAEGDGATPGKTVVTLTTVNLK